MEFIFKNNNTMNNRKIKFGGGEEFVGDFFCIYMITYKVHKIL
jgi:hypothetical protein